MRTPNDYKVAPETDLRKKVIVMHLFDNDAREEESLCGAETSAHERIGVGLLPGSTEGRHSGWDRLRGV